MPKGKTDTKRFEKQEKRRQRNRSVRSAVKTYVIRARQAITPSTAGEESTVEAVLRAIQELDKAAQKGVLHRNNAARRKSRLVKRLHSLQSAA